MYDNQILVKLIHVQVNWLAARDNFLVTFSQLGILHPPFLNPLKDRGPYEESDNEQSNDEETLIS